MSEIGLFEAMYSARALRRLKPDPVPDEIITKILDAAIRAPSAGNSQHWVFIVVRDAEQRRKLAVIYRKASDIAKAIYQARGRPAAHDRRAVPTDDVSRGLSLAAHGRGAGAPGALPPRSPGAPARDAAA